MADEDPLLSDLCSICHVNPPKYRCPRCSIRTCSLPCTRRHKLWSQCSGVRDPAAYLKRNELNTESAFDRDFNFITGIERTLERAERDVDNRGIDLARGAHNDDAGAEGEQGSASGRKRKHPNQGLAKGEAGFLRGAEASGVKVIRAPKGMSRNKQNGSRLHPKHKCLAWTVEWITSDGQKTIRNSVVETCSIAEAYDRCCPRPKDHESTSAPVTEKQDKKDDLETANKDTDSAACAAPQEQATTGTEITSSNTPQSPAQEPSETPADASTETIIEETGKRIDHISSHRGLFFYLHRPRAASKKPVLAPLLQSATLKDVLRNRTVLEFPTIYALPDQAEGLLANQEKSPFILEEEYLRTAEPDEIRQSAMDGEDELTATQTFPESLVDLQNVDENKVLEVLKQDLFEPVPDTGSAV